MTVELHLGDCLEVMRSMPDKSVDAVITDPPYGMKLDADFSKMANKNGLFDAEKMKYNICFLISFEIIDTRPAHNKALMLTACSAKRRLGCCFLTRLGSHSQSPGASTASEDGQVCPVQGRRECETLYVIPWKVRASMREG